MEARCAGLSDSYLTEGEDRPSVEEELARLRDSKPAAGGQYYDETRVGRDGYKGEYYGERRNLGDLDYRELGGHPLQRSGSERDESLTTSLMRENSSLRVRSHCGVLTSPRGGDSITGTEPVAPE